MTAALAGAPPRLLRKLGAVFGLAVGVGSMIGAGILRTPGSVAKLTPSFSVIMALWVFAALHSLLGANVAAELFTEVKQAGGVYVPVRRAFGNAVGSVIGWIDIINNAAATAALALAGVDFLTLAWPGAHDRPLQLAIGIIAAVFAINALGVREGRAAQVAMTAIKVGILLLIGAAGLLLPSTPRAPAASAPDLSLAAAIGAYQLIIGAYSGWPNPAYFVEEDVAPNRNVPKALFGSVLAVAVLYVVINLLLLRIFPVAALGGMAIPVGEVIGRLAGSAGTLLLGITGFILIVGCCNAGLMVSPRIIYGLARDGLFPKWGAQVSQSGTPQIGLAVVTIVSVLLVATGSFEAAFRLIAATGAVTLLALDLSLFALRIREPELERPFQAWGYPWLPLAAVLLDTGFLAAMLWFDPMSGAITVSTLLLGAGVWMVIGTARKRLSKSTLDS